MRSAYAARGNEVVNGLFRENSLIMENIAASEEADAGESRFADMASLASLASMHDADSGGLAQLRAGLKAEVVFSGPKVTIFEDQTPRDFNVSSSALLHILNEKERGRGDAALEKVLKAPRLAEFVDGEPVLSPGQRLKRLTDTESGSTGSLLGQRLLKPETLTPLMLTRVSKTPEPQIAAALTDRLLPILAHSSPNIALKTVAELAIIDSVARSVQPDLGEMIGAVADSQARQIGAFMGSIERAIDTAARNLQGLVGREVTDNRSIKISAQAARGAIDSIENVLGAKATRENSGNFKGEINESIVHRERPMAFGDVTVRVKPFNAHSRTTHFAASSAPIGSSRDQITFHNATDTGAYASATGPAVCASSATVVEAHFHSDGFEVEINVNP